ncbi:uncharacterized protein LOC144433504 isoform X1 [Glandiceps talaboti]
MTTMKLFIICTYIVLFPASSALIQSSKPCRFIEQHIILCTLCQLIEIPSSIPTSTEELWLDYNAIDVVRNGSFHGLKSLTFLILSSNDISMIEEDAFSELHNLQFLDLSSNRLSKISPKLFVSLLKLKTLNIASNPLHEIPSEAIGVLGNLQRIDVSDLSYVSAKLCPQFRNLTHLKEIRLADNLLPLSVRQGDFEVLKNHHLDLVDVSGNILTGFDPLVFSNVGSIQNLTIGTIMLSNSSQLEGLLYSVGMVLGLKALELRVEKVTDFPTVLNFQMFENLTSLKLTINDLLELEDFLFSTLSQLRHLQLTICDLESIGDKAFAGLEQLEHLDLSYNELTAVPKSSFHPRWCHSLKYLRLKYNRIRTITPYTFEGLCVLKVLDLEHNELVLSSSSKSLVFYGLPELKVLCLNSNNILQFIFAYLTPLVSLQKLYASNSNIDFLQDLERPLPQNNTLLQFKKLEVLDLSGNEIGSDFQNVNGNIFPNVKDLTLNNVYLWDHVLPQLSHCHGLVRLSLSSNRITQIPRTMFANLTNLQMLDLHSNSLSYLDKDVFADLSSITTLVLNDNKFTNFNVSVVINLHSLYSISLVGNPFTCSCDLVAFKDFMMTSDVYFFAGSTYDCTSLDRVTGQYIIDFNPDCVNHLPMRLSVSLTTVTVVLIIIGYVCHRKQWHLKYAVFIVKGKIRGYDAIDHADPEEHHMIYDAFIAYNNKDQDWVLHNLVPTLERGEPPEFKLCVDYRNFEVGKAVIENIVDSVHSSCKTILVLTPNFVASEWCYFEMQMAQHRLFDDHRDVIIPILLTDIPHSKYSKLLWRILCKRTCYKWTDDPRGQIVFWEKLRKALRKPCKINHAVEV